MIVRMFLLSLLSMRDLACMDTAEIPILEYIFSIRLTQKYIRDMSKALRKNIPY